MEDLQQQNNNEIENLDIRETVESYLKYWYIFILGIGIALVIGYIYLRYAPVVYSTTATIVIKDDASGGVPAELSALGNFSGFFGRMNASKLENDLIIFKSKKLNEETVKALELNVVYQIDGNIKDTELYNTSPIKVSYLLINDNDTSRNQQTAPQLYVKILSEATYQILEPAGFQDKIYNFGDKVTISNTTITVLPATLNGKNINNYIGKTVIATYGALQNVATNYQNRVEVTNKVRNSNVVEVGISSVVPDKAEDYINELIFQFNKDAINDQTQIAQKTSNFINDRLEIITRELDSVEGNKEQFKSRNRLTDIAAEAQLSLQNASEFEKRQFDVGTQLELSNSMIEFVEGASNDELLPANIGLNAENVASSVSSYNQLVLERNRLLKNSTSKNPVVINITNQINQLKANITSSLENSRRSLQLTMKDLNIQESTLNNKIAKVPTNEKIFRSIERQQSIKEQLYLFLLTQREQTNISLSVTAPKAKVVDPAYTLTTPVSPNRMIIYAGAALAGLLIPFLFIYVSRLLSTKIKNRKDVERRLPNLSILGEIPKIKRGESDLIEVNDRSVLAESFRILRTNLQYLFVNKDANSQDAKRVFVTSTIKGEGKTFVAFNLALSLSSMNKKVVLIGADIRNPQLQRYLPAEAKQMKGLTEFIVDDTLHAKELILNSDYIGLDIILSGAIPPNPAELLIQNRTGEIFDQLEEEYDYIIVDTAPSMLVTDTILINKYSDIMLYVTRADYTDKRLLEFPKDAIDDKRLTNVNMVLNNVSMSNFGYGNKYGYAYSEDKPGFWQRIFRR